MRLHRHLLGGLALLFMGVSALRAETPPSALRLIPAEADLLFQVHSPRKIHDLLLNLELFKELQKFPTTQEFFRSTQARRFGQLLTYYEKELAGPYPQLLDQLAANIAVGVKLGPNPAPTLVAIQGRDPKLTGQFTTLLLNVVEQELQRQEAKDRPEKTTYQGVDVIKIGKEFYLATVGSAILISNHETALQKGLDLAQGREQKSLADSASVAEARKLLPKDVLASVWVNMDTVRLAPGAKEIYKKGPRDIGLTITFGGYLDVLGRTPFVCAGVQANDHGMLTTIRIPSGREGMGPELGLHMPTDARVPGSRPLLEPRGVLYSDSVYLDLGRIWNDRAKLFVADQVKAMEKFDQDSGRIPFINVQLSKLLTGAGNYQRFVAVNQPKVGYKITPKTSIPAFAYVLEMNDPDSFSRTVETALRGVGFFNSTQFKLKLVEEKHKDCQIIGYRFPEDEVVKADVNQIRFKFSPCFVRVGNQMVFSSTIELSREMVELLQKESQAGNKGEPATSRRRIYPTGIAQVLHAFEDQLVTQGVLDQAIPAEESRAQVKAFLELLQKQGLFAIDVNYGARELHYDVRIQVPK